MIISKIVFAGCFVVALSNIAFADEVRANAQGTDTVFVGTDHSRHDVRVYDDHRRDYIRRHHDRDVHEHGAHVDIDVNR